MRFPFLILETGQRVIRLWLYWNFHKPEAERRHRLLLGLYWGII